MPRLIKIDYLPWKNWYTGLDSESHHSHALKSLFELLPFSRRYLGGVIYLSNTVKLHTI